MKEKEQKEDYLSGWEALNIPTKDGQTADWHPLNHFNENKELKTYKYNEILKDRGIEKRFVPYLQKECYVANFPRAIADLVCEGNTKELKNCVADFLNKEEEKLFEYLSKLFQNHKLAK